MGIEDDNWDAAAGVMCSSCGQESFRVKDGLCFPCYEQRTVEGVEKAEVKRVKRSCMRRLNNGTLTLADLRAGRG